MKKYPYVGKLKNENGLVLFLEKDKGIQLNADGSGGVSFEIGKYCDLWNEAYFEDYTFQYFSNTYGEVVDKEHADFLMDVIEGKGFEVEGSYEDGDGYFNFYELWGSLLSFSDGIETCKIYGGKEVYFPRPPKDYFKSKEDSKHIFKVGDEVVYRGEECEILTSRINPSKNLVAAIMCKENYNLKWVSFDELQPPLTEEEKLKNIKLDAISEVLEESREYCEKVLEELNSLGYDVVKLAKKG